MLSVNIQCFLGLTKTVHLASVAPGTASACRASASAAPDTLDKTVLSVSIVQCFLGLTVHLASVAPGTVSAARASASAAPDTSARTARSVSIQCVFALPKPHI